MPHVRRHRLVTPISLLLLSQSPILAQDMGRGSLHRGGTEPRLAVLGSTPGKLTRLRMSDLPRSGSPTVVFAIGTEPDRTPLDPLGLKGAVLGVDLRTAMLSRPVPVTSAGVAELAIRVQPAWRGLEVHVQGFLLDPGSNPPLAASDSQSLIVGRPEPEVVSVIRGTTVEEVELARFLTDGSDGRDAPFLKGLRFQRLRLDGVFEARSHRPDLPSTFGNGSRSEPLGVRLQDGSVLYMVKQLAPGFDSILRIHQGGDVEIVDRAPSRPGVNRYVSRIGASDYGPFVGILRSSGRQLLLYRTDGTNWPGSPSPLLSVALPVSRDPVLSTGRFGRKVLACTAPGVGVLLVSLATGGITRVTFPPSGGRTPTYFDIEIADGGGRVFALGAGAAPSRKDIYVVRENGSAVNISRRPAAYATANFPSSPRHIANEMSPRLVMDPAGSWVGYVELLGRDRELYLSSTARPRPVLLSPAATFASSVRRMSIVRAGAGGFLIGAGADMAQLDLFHTGNDVPTDVTDLTRTSLSNGQPFLGNGTLMFSGARLETLPGRSEILHRVLSPRQSSHLVISDSPGQRARIHRGVGGTSYYDRGTRMLVGVESRSGRPVPRRVVVIDPGDFSARAPRFVPLPVGANVREIRKGVAPATALMIVYGRSFSDLYEVTLTPLGIRRRTTTGMVRIRVDRTNGNALLLGNGSLPAGFGLFRWSPSGGLRQLVPSALGILGFLQPPMQ